MPAETASAVGSAAVAGALAVGLVGCGQWGKNILRDLVGLGCSVPVVVRSAANSAVARQLGCDRVVSSVGDLPRIDGVVVATPTTTHADVLGEVLTLGVPVYVEKPLTVDVESADRLATAAGDRLFVMDKWRHHPGVQRLARIARDGELGPVVGLRTVRIGWGNPHEVDAVWILAPHDLSIGLEILGSLAAPGYAVVDKANGGVVGLSAILGHRPWHVFEVSARSEHRNREIRLLCEGGHAVLADPYDDHLKVYSATTASEPTPEHWPISTELPLLRELRAFVKHLGGGPPPASSAADGAAIVRTLADLRSAATGH